MVSIRLAQPGEESLGAAFIADAREHQREQGFVQWSETSPNIDDVRGDIARNRGYFITEDGEPFGYFMVDFAGEPHYAHIDGAWQTDRPYAVIHRVAFGKAGRGKGASAAMFRLVRELCDSRGITAMRIDTGYDNAKMHHILQREGFVRCGVVRLPVGERVAYEKYW